MKPSSLNLDVREDIRQGREPFSKIMDAVAQLAPGQDLRLLAPFEPVPLFHVLGKQGFNHTAKGIGGGDWEVLFSRTGETAARAEEKPKKSGCTCSMSTFSNVIELDLRGLEPPQPLVTILETLASLPDGAVLSAQTDRRPLHLYAQLEERGFTGQTEETKNGSFITRISRR